MQAAQSRLQKQYERELEGHEALFGQHPGREKTDLWCIGRWLPKEGGLAKEIRSGF